MKKIALIALILISISLVSAQVYFYYDNDHDYKERIIERELYLEDGVYHTKTDVTYIDYENDNRFSTYEYRYGYTYRETPEYLDRYKTKYLTKVTILEDDEDEIEGEEESNDDSPYIYKKYLPYFDRYEEVTCYKTAPEGKFIYRKCPE